MEKISILPGASPNLSAASYCIFDETHTLANALRWMIMKNPKVEFCGYSAPHPSENKIHLRIQMYDEESSLNALLAALNNLEALCDVVGQEYARAMERGPVEEAGEA